MRSIKDTDQRTRRAQICTVFSGDALLLWSSRSGTVLLKNLTHSQHRRLKSRPRNRTNRQSSKQGFERIVEHTRPAINPRACKGLGKASYFSPLRVELLGKSRRNVPILTLHSMLEIGPLPYRFFQHDPVSPCRAPARPAESSTASR